MKKITLLSICIFFLCNCSEKQEWLEPKDEVPPGPISDVVIENINGGAIINYKLPNDKDLLGVKGTYHISENSKEMKIFSSAFVDTIEVKGFSDTKKRIVKLICLALQYNL